MSERLVILPTGENLLVSQEDHLFALGFDLSWNGHYIYCHRPGWKGKKKLFHRILAEHLGMDVSNEIDHKDRNTLNCTRGNIRSATSSQNKLNKLCNGVFWNSQKRKWQAKLQLNGGVTHLGFFEDYDAAIRRYRAKHAEHFGTFSPYYDDASSWDNQG